MIYGIYGLTTEEIEIVENSLKQQDIVVLSFGKGAYEEIAEAKQRGLHMELLIADKLLEYEEEAKQGKIL